jgi:hypothetical protein
MPRLRLTVLALFACAAALSAAEGELRSADSFASIDDPAERSVALFVEASKVLTHPRCINCHPSGDAPLQSDGVLHEPPVRRGRAGFGVAGMECKSCHQRQNFDPGRVPGAPSWHLAPLKMAWEGLSLRELCEQIKDPERNGQRTVDEIVEHMTEDALVGWAWSPGPGREPPPGDQEVFGQLIAKWAKSGAACPQ